MKFIKRLAFAIVFALAFAAPSFGAATKVVHSIVKGTYAEITALTGDYASQQGYASDYGIGQGLMLYWNGSTWKLPAGCQLLARSHVAVTTAADTATNTAFTATLPAMGANDYIRVEFGWTHTNSANNKVYTVEVDGSTMYTNTVTTTEMLHSFTTIHQRNSASAQVAMANTTAGYGTSSGTIQTATRNLSSAGKTILVRSAKASGGETTTLEYADAFVCGG